MPHSSKRLRLPASRWTHRLSTWCCKSASSRRKGDREAEALRECGHIGDVLRCRHIRGLESKHPYGRDARDFDAVELCGAGETAERVLDPVDVLAGCVVREHMYVDLAPTVAEHKR